MKLLTLAIITLILVSGIFIFKSVSAYYCVDPIKDNPSVQDFKMKVNQLAIEQDIKQGLTEEQIITKIKFFNPCNK